MDKKTYRYNIDSLTYKFYLLFRKNPPNIINGMSSGADIASAIGRDGARQDTMYPKPTTTWPVKNMISSNQYMLLLYNFGVNRKETNIL